MRTFNLILPILLIDAALAQQPPTLPPMVFPKELKSADSSKGTETSPPQVDPANSYANRREAALKALQAGYQDARRNRARAIRLLLVSLHRDPTIAKTLYDMGVLCAQDQRWQDALDFNLAAQKANPEPDLNQKIASEIARLQVIVPLESTPAGQKQRRFDMLLIKDLEEFKKTDDKIAALTQVRDLGSVDKTRWEALAFAGILHAKIGEFAVSAHDFTEAASRASATSRQKLESAAQIAQREASYVDQKNTADGLLEKKDYISAAKTYERAWEDSRGHFDVAMESAKDFLLGDEITSAVKILAQLRDVAPDELSAKAVAMLKELGSISEIAQKEAARPKAVVAGSQMVNVTQRVEAIVGKLSTPEMELAARENPQLEPDNTHILPVPDTDLDDAGIDMFPINESIFARYQRDLAAQTASPSIPDQSQLPADLAPPETAKPAPSSRQSRELH